MRRTAAALTVPTLLLALTACGSGSDEADPGATPAAGKVPAGVAKMYSVLEEEVADRGGSVEAGDWKVSYIVESAEPWFESHQGHGEMFRKPAKGETNHVEIIPREKSTGRIVPDVPVSLQIVDGAGKVVAQGPLSFYYSTFFHYANNFSVKPGTYTIKATLGAPTFRKHGDEADGPALAKGATVTFDDVTFE